MKIDRNWFETFECGGAKAFEFKTVNEDIGFYQDYSGYRKIFFEIKTEQMIGEIKESENYTSFKQYYHAVCQYGWDGKKATKKEFFKTLCTRAEYSVAYAMLMEEYKNRK